MARISDIVTIACHMVRVRESRIVGENRLSAACAVRSAIYIIAREHGHSYPAIGRAVGMRDHSTVINGVENTSRWHASIGPRFQQFIDELRHNALIAPPFVAETKWKPGRLFHLGRIVPIRNHGCQRKRIPAVCNRAIVQPEPRRLRRIATPASRQARFEAMISQNINDMDMISLAIQREVMAL